MDQLTAMKLFLRVVQTGAISRAGRSLGMSSTAASKRLADLEEVLGVRLLNRTTRRLSLTEAGQRFHDQLKPLLVDLETLVRGVEDLEVRPRGLLRVLARRSFGMMHVVPTLPAFRARYPDVDVDLKLTEVLEIAPVDGIDVVIRLGKPTEKSLDWRLLASDRRILCASPGYLERHSAPANPSDLNRHPCLAYGREAEPSVWVFEKDQRRREIPITGPLRSNSGEVLRQATLDGLGLAVLPRWMVETDLARGTLMSCLDDHRVYPAGYSAEIYAVFPRDRLVPAKVLAFVNHLAERMDEMTSLS